MPAGLPRRHIVNSCKHVTDMNLAPRHLRAAYRSGELKPSDVAAHVLSRLDDADQSGVWISTANPQGVMAKARALDARIGEIGELPLYGLVFSVKDCIDVADEQTTSACPEFAYTAKDTSPVVADAIAAGAIYLGKTNMDQFATGLVGVRSPYGIARNPHNPDYIPGGSSSGAAVSVATGTSSFAFGTDTGGSGRVPASYCGVTGFKPAPGAFSQRGMVYACRSFDTISLYTCDPRDGHEIYRVLARRDVEDCFSPVDSAGWTEQASPARPLNIATPRPDQLRFFGNAETEALFGDGLRKLRQLDLSVALVDFAPFISVNDLMFFGPFLAERDVSVGAFLDANPEAGVKIVRDLVIGSRKFTAADAYRALYKVKEVQRSLRDFWQVHDALVVPTVGTVLSIDDVARDPLTANFNNGYYTNYANPLGLAAIAVPNRRHRSRRALWHHVPGAGRPGAPAHRSGLRFHGGFGRARTSAPRCNPSGDLLAFEPSLEGRPIVGRSDAHEVADPVEPRADLPRPGTGRYVLKALDKPDLELVMRTGRLATYQNREYLLREGEPANGIHIILNGIVESTHAGTQGRELMLSTWEADDFVGAPYILGDHRHSWSARALGRVEALHLDQDAVRRLIAQSPPFAVALIECLGFKGETYSMLAQTLAGQKAAERLVLLLVKLCENAAQDESGPISLGRITQANLARMIGATRQSISLILSRLQNDGIIWTGPTKMVVNDLAALRKQVAD
ncbi:Asp-tRNA(Asn)/Glu-tRNA(Gln) amidotransferase A subunit family amidase/CRP-like cAMP-binding protein [Bradyrhizobium sp. GM0.4]